jgi:C4-dicarboxylate-specific signal transduction histidine kinase
VQEDERKRENRLALLNKIADLQRGIARSFSFARILDFANRSFCNIIRRRGRKGEMRRKEMVQMIQSRLPFLGSSCTSNLVLYRGL